MWNPGGRETFDVLWPHSSDAVFRNICDPLWMDRLLPLRVRTRCLSECNNFQQVRLLYDHTQLLQYDLICCCDKPIEDILCIDVLLFTICCRFGLYAVADVILFWKQLISTVSFLVVFVIKRTSSCTVRMLVFLLFYLLIMAVKEFVIQRYRCSCFINIHTLSDYGYQWKCLVPLLTDKSE